MSEELRKDTVKILIEILETDSAAKRDSIRAISNYIDRLEDELYDLREYRAFNEKSSEATTG